MIRIIIPFWEFFMIIMVPYWGLLMIIMVPFWGVFYDSYGIIVKGVLMMIIVGSGCRV